MFALELSMGKKSIYDENKILAFFTKSILNSGYENTSMRMIASEFNMPVSSLYRHFASKEEMLDRVLKPVIDIFNGIYEEYKEKNYEYLKTLTIEEVFDKQRTPIDFLDLLYKYHNEFKILLSRLKGTKYENFFDELIDYEIKTSIEFFDALKKCGFNVKEIDYKYLRIITENNFNAYFSVIKNDLSYDEALEFLDIINDYNVAGYKKLFIKK